MHTNVTACAIDDGIVTDDEILVITVKRVVIADGAEVGIHREQIRTSLAVFVEIDERVL